MSRPVTLPPDLPLLEDGARVGGWWSEEADASGRVRCELCPRECVLRPGDRGFCFVRENRDGRMVLNTYGRSTGFCIDPIEKKPLNHFYPGTSVLSFGTAGCNLGCKFCQNWDISKSREIERLSEVATPEAIAQTARRYDCRSVAFTYNDPVIWAEYAIDTAHACRQLGIAPVAVTAGYITPAARPGFFQAMDAANVDLKAFTEGFYFHLAAAHLQPVLETLNWLAHESDTWFEITNLVIPQANDSDDEFRRMCDWLLQHVGDSVPIHFTAFHPDFKMRDRPATSRETLLRAHDVATQTGLKYAYIGNLFDGQRQSTYCPGCGECLIERQGYQIGHYRLLGNRCSRCQQQIPGHFDTKPGNWGPRRQPVRIETVATPPGASAGRNDMSGNPAPHRLSLNPQQQTAIGELAWNVVEEQILGRPLHDVPADLAQAATQRIFGAFVTLKRQGRLRACCGVLGSLSPLRDAVIGAAQRTALEDHRLPPISPDELPFLQLDVTLLHDFETLGTVPDERLAAVTIGTHGLRIAGRGHSGLLLPIVAAENGWTAEQFLQQVCVKAQLPPTAWQQADVQLQRFTGTRIVAPSPQPTLERLAANIPPRFSAADHSALTRYCSDNLTALLSGATPSYYAPDCPDGPVHGVLLIVHHSDGSRSHQLYQLNPLHTMPLQATLFQFTQQAAAWLATEGTYLDPQLTLALLEDPAMHGTLDDPDPRSASSTPRCWVASCGPAHNRSLSAASSGHAALLYRPSDTPDQIIADLRRKVRPEDSRGAALMSYRVQSAGRELAVNDFPQSDPAADPRPPAVAGMFYPSDPATLDRQRSELFAGRKRSPQSAPAILLPHAGWRYSGRIAAQVLNQVRIPSRAIILGPKHTPLGINCAVAPHPSWQLPSGQVAGDPHFAAQLVAAVDLLDFDAQAHRQEHAIEVELPLLQFLAPETAVVGVVLHAIDWPSCAQFASQLAPLLRAQPDPPLLIVSSDMNHFATDSENRRLDALALDALSTLDPRSAFETIRRHHISMCGLVPAVIVMETLRLLGQLHAVERVAYATSADAGGDTSRVVGYAGLIFH